ncbi:hypothetical protein KQX54_017408 [Cotesia glomerata]|uniref:Uncharacterized protein n=1 Tax=Cotesia glomerata TaxID=32391 RepID=A0AAV7HY34_COTGL|nr:hypothetical protein KQX54_017408 [Cotesia glomerata]
MRDIRYKWNEGPNSVGVSSEVSLPQFKVLGHRQRAMEISLTTGNTLFTSTDKDDKGNMNFRRVTITFKDRSTPHSILLISVPTVVQRTNDGSQTVDKTYFWNPLTTFSKKVLEQFAYGLLLLSRIYLMSFLVLSLCREISTNGNDCSAVCGMRKSTDVDTESEQ